MTLMPPAVLGAAAADEHQRVDDQRSSRCSSRRSRRCRTRRSAASTAWVNAASTLSPTPSGPSVRGLVHSKRQHAPAKPTTSSATVPPDGQPGVGRPGAGLRHSPGQLEQHREAEAAGDDAEGERQADPPVADEADQAVAEQREAGVVEGRDRVEDAVPQRSAERVVVRRGRTGRSARRAIDQPRQTSMVGATRSSTCRTSPGPGCALSAWASSRVRRPSRRETTG